MSTRKATWRYGVRWRTYFSGYGAVSPASGSRSTVTPPCWSATVPWFLSLNTGQRRSFSEDRLAAMFDAFYPPRTRGDFTFYLPLVMAAGSMLDVARGTGALLHWAREAGHSGRRTGPADARYERRRVSLRRRIPA